jgi:hypothetical protein
VSEASDIVARLSHQYFWGWQEANWAQLREALAPDVVFEDPRLGRIEGVDAHIALYIDSKRFPGRTGVAMRRTVHSEDAAFISYDVYLGHWRKQTVVDQLSVRGGRIVHVLSVTSGRRERLPPTPELDPAVRDGGIRPARLQVGRPIVSMPYDSCRGLLEIAASSLLEREPRRRTSLVRPAFTGELVDRVAAVSRELNTERTTRYVVISPNAMSPMPTLVVRKCIPGAAKSVCDLSGIAIATTPTAIAARAKMPNI